MGDKLSVLLLEDFDRGAAALASHIEAGDLELRFRAVSDIEEFRAALFSGEWDCVLVADSARLLSPMDAFAVMRESGSGVPLLVVSVYDGGFVVVKAIRASADKYSPDSTVRPLIQVLRSIEPDGGDRASTAEMRRQVLLEIVQAGAATPDQSEFLGKVHVALGRLLHSGGCSVMLRDPLSGRCDFAYWADEIEDLPDPNGPLRSLSDRVLLTGEPLVSEEGAVADGMRGNAWPAWMGVPLRTASRTFGVLAVHSHRDGLAFDAHDLEFLTLAGNQVAISIERRRTDRALRESEERYRRLFDYAPDGIIIGDPAARILDVNASLGRILGYTRGELLAMSAADMVEPTEIPQIDQALHEISNRSEHHREWKLRRKDGTVLSADVSATRMPDGNTLAIVRDMSERNKAEAELASLTVEIARQRERLNNIVDNVPGVVWETAFDSEKSSGMIDFVSEHVTELLGYTVDEWLSASEFRRSIIRPDKREKVTEASRRIVPGRENVEEIPFIAKNGREVWVEARSTAITNEVGEVVGTRGVMIDITERRRSEQALRHSEERYRDLVENAHDIIYVHDLNGNYTSMNKAAELIMGYSKEEMLSMNMSQTIVPEFLDRARAMLAAKLAGEEVTAYELEVFAKDGRRVALEVNTRLTYAGGRPVAVQGIARDVTGRKLLEDKFRQSQRMEAVGLLAGGISHDFNNLLTAIIGYSELTLARMDADDPLRGNVAEIKETGERAAALTHQLLAFSRKQILRPVVHNLNSVIGGMENMLRRIVREDVEFDIRLDERLANIAADPGQLEQVIVNLVVNAEDAMPAGGRLSIATENVSIDAAEHQGVAKLGSGPFVRMTVADIGEGMDSETQEHIFEPFFTTKELGKGTGLGLSTVHGIVKQSGGEIFVQSAKGAGTTFTIYLPSVESAAERIERTGVAAAPGAGPGAVLMVEDDPIVRKLVHEVLINAGYEVLEAASGEAALALCDGRRDGPINLLLTDLVMPGMSGIELTERFLLRHPQAKVLIMSGYSGKTPLGELAPKFDALFIEKPFSPDALIGKIREMLATSIPNETAAASPGS